MISSESTNAAETSETSVVESAITSETNPTEMTRPSETEAVETEASTEASATANESTTSESASTETSATSTLPTETEEATITKEPRAVVAVTKPSAVSGLRVTSSGNKTVSLAWNLVKADFYAVYRKVNNGALTYIGGTSGTYNRFTNKAAVNDYNNFYWVAAYNVDASGKKHFSSFGSYVYAKPENRPAKVTGVNAFSLYSNQVTLTWNRVSGAQYYAIYRKVGSGTMQYVAAVPGTQLRYVDNKATNDVFNYYWVYAFNYNSLNKQLFSPASAYVYAKPLTKPATVSGLKATAVKSQQVKLTWNAAAGAHNYAVFRRNAAGTFVYIAATPASQKYFIDTTATNDVFNFYMVRAYRPNLNGTRTYGDAGAYVYAKPTAATGANYFTNGEYIVGKDIAPGRYVFTCDASDSGNIVVWRPYTIDGFNTEDLIINDIVSGRPGYQSPSVSVPLENGDRLEIMGLDKAYYTKVTTNIVSNRLTAGYWIVGQNIAAGEYVVTPKAGSSGYLEISANHNTLYYADLGGTDHPASATVTLYNGYAIEIAFLEYMDFKKVG